MTDKPRIVVTMEGGCIHSICVDQADAVEVMLVDYDVEGSDDYTTLADVNSDGTDDTNVNNAHVWEVLPQHAPGFVSGRFRQMNALDVREEEADLETVSTTKH